MEKTDNIISLHPENAIYNAFSVYDEPGCRDGMDCKVVEMDEKRSMVTMQTMPGGIPGKMIAAPMRDFCDISMKTGDRVYVETVRPGVINVISNDSDAKNLEMRPYSGMSYRQGRILSMEKLKSAMHMYASNQLSGTLTPEKSKTALHIIQAMVMVAVDLRVNQHRNISAQDDRCINIDYNHVEALKRDYLYAGKTVAPEISLNRLIQDYLDVATKKLSGANISPVSLSVDQYLVDEPAHVDNFFKTAGEVLKQAVFPEVAQQLHKNMRNRYRDISKRLRDSVKASTGTATEQDFSTTDENGAAPGM